MRRTLTLLVLIPLMVGLLGQPGDVAAAPGQQVARGDCGIYYNKRPAEGQIDYIMYANQFRGPGCTGTFGLEDGQTQTAIIRWSLQVYNTPDYGSQPTFVDFGLTGGGHAGGITNSSVGEPGNGRAISDPFTIIMQPATIGTPEQQTWPMNAILVITARFSPALATNTPAPSRTPTPTISQASTTCSSVSQLTELYTVDGNEARQYQTDLPLGTTAVRLSSFDLGGGMHQTLTLGGQVVNDQDVSDDGDEHWFTGQLTNIHLQYASTGSGRLYVHLMVCIDSSITPTATPIPFSCPVFNLIDLYELNGNGDRTFSAVLAANTVAVRVASEDDGHGYQQTLSIGGQTLNSQPVSDVGDERWYTGAYGGLPLAYTASGGSGRLYTHIEACIIAPTATPTTMATPSPTFRQASTWTPTRTTTGSPTNTPTTTPTVTGTRPVAGECALSTTYNIPVAPGTITITLTIGVRFVVADNPIKINYGANAIDINPGSYEWQQASAEYTLYSLTGPARLLLCVGDTASATPVAPTLLPTNDPISGDCYPATPIPGQDPAAMPDLALILPTWTATVAVTGTAGVTATMSISLTAVVQLVGTVSTGIISPAGAIATLTAPYGWSSGAAASASWTSYMTPALSWLAIVNPASPVWEVEGGPLWAIAPLVKPVLPIIGFALLIVAVRFALFVGKLLLSMLDLIIKAIELIPGE